MLTGTILRSCLLHNTHAHLGGNLNTAERNVTGVVTKLNIDRIHLIVLIVVISKHLSMVCQSASSREVCPCGFIGIGIRATSGKQFREDAADDRSQERETGAHDSDVAFCGGPIGGCDVAVCSVG